MWERKGLGIRFAAAFIDGIIVAVISNVLIQVAGIVGVILAALIIFGYPGIEIMTGASPGKMALKLKVVAESGAPATRDQLVQRAMLRWLGNFINGAMTLLGLIPVLGTLASLGAVAGAIIMIVLLVLSWKTLQATRQGYWDVRAKTAVVGPASAVAAPLAGQVPPPQA